MAWERRGNGQYYYGKRRIGDRVVSVYVGKGPLAEMLAWDAAQEAADRERNAEQQRLAIEDWRALSSEVEAIERESEALLESYGLHRPKRGPWRVKRGKQES